jgi:hypothetical protein
MEREGRTQVALVLLTLGHVAVSLAGIFYGLAAAFGMISGRVEKRTNEWFLITTIATSVTGFFLPLQQFLPSHGIGIASLIVLAFASAGYWQYRLQGLWLKTYAIGAAVALYLNVFVLVVQLYRHIPVLKELAPTQTEPAFQLTQLVVLIAFIVLGVRVAKAVGKTTGPDLSATAAL